MKLCLVCNFQFGDEQDLCPKDLSRLVPIGKDPLIGMVIQDRYRIESLVAKGSMGVIYKATQQSIGRDVAIKVMHGYLVSDEESMKRYHKEAKAASRLNHPNITTVYDFGVLASGQPYIVMDLLQGKALSDILQQRGQLTPNQTMMVMNQVCQALSEAHARGVVHRDIKPENIVIEELPDGRNILVKVVDFGIATFAAEGEDTIGKITKTGTVCGSPFYMSPEQCDGGKVDKRSDLYSLGIVLFECLTGKVPFDSKDIYQVLTMQVKDPPPRLKKIRADLQFSDELELVVNKALAKEPDARYQSAQEFWAAVAQAGGLKTGRKPEPTSSIMRPNLQVPPPGAGATGPGAAGGAGGAGANSAAAQKSGEHVLSYAEQIKLQALAAAGGTMPGSGPDPGTGMGMGLPLSGGSGGTGAMGGAMSGSTSGGGIPNAGGAPGTAGTAGGPGGIAGSSGVGMDKSTGGNPNPFAGMGIAGGASSPGSGAAGSNSGAPAGQGSASPSGGRGSLGGNSSAGNSGTNPGGRGSGQGASVTDTGDFGMDNEELRKKIHEASTKFKSAPQKQEASSMMKMINLVALPLLTGLVTITLFAVMAIEMLKHSRASNERQEQQQHQSTTNQPDPSQQALTPEALMAQDRLDEARTILEERKNQGKLSEGDQVTLDWVYIKLSRHEAKAKRYKQAVAFLEGVSDAMKDDEEVQSSLKKYKKLAK